MGFHKRFVSMDMITEYLEYDGDLSVLFSSDAFIFMDEGSTKVYNKHKEGVSDNEIKELIKNGKIE